MIENITVGTEDDGQRLDRWLKKKYPAVSFGDVQKALRTGQLRVDGKRAKGDARLAAGQSVRIPPQMKSPLRKERILPDAAREFIRGLVIYKDKDIIALNKPQGLAVQGGSKVRRHIDGMLDGLAEDGVRPHLVHRLDRDTSGVLLLARHTKAARALGDMFKGREMRKYYWAITVPVPEMYQGKVQSALAKVSGPGGEKMMAVDDAEGKYALTYYQVMESAGGKVGWVAFWPHTGRTHQIRVHAQQMGCPILGDEKYVRADDPDPNRIYAEIPELPETLHLHARRLIFRHPFTGKKMDISAPLSGDMLETFRFFGFDHKDKTDPFAEIA